MPPIVAPEPVGCVRASTAGSSSLPSPKSPSLTVDPGSSAAAARARTSRAACRIENAADRVEIATPRRRGELADVVTHVHAVRVFGLSGHDSHPRFTGSPRLPPGGREGRGPPVSAPGRDVSSLVAPGPDGLAMAWSAA